MKLFGTETFTIAMDFKPIAMVKANLFFTMYSYSGVYILPQLLNSFLLT